MTFVEEGQRLQGLCTIGSAYLPVCSRCSKLVIIIKSVGSIRC